MTILDEHRSKRRKKGDLPPIGNGNGNGNGEGPAPTHHAPPRPAEASSPASIEAINFAAYLRHAVAQDGSRRAFVSAKRELPGDLSWHAVTLKELDEQTDSLARGLTGWGVTRGQRVTLLANCSPDSLRAVIALLKIGAVPSWIEPGRSLEDIASCLKQATSTLLLTTATGLLQRIMRPKLFTGTRCLLLDSLLPINLGKKLAPLRSLERAEASHLALAATRPLDPAIIVFTSGCSSPPRAVVLDHATLIAQAESLRRSQGLNEGEVVLAPDLLHALMLLSLGKCVVLPGKTDPARLLATIDAHGVTTVIGSPASWRAVADDCARAGRALPGLRQVIFSGGPVSLATMSAVASVLPAGDVRSLYGLTEAFPVASITARDAMETHEVSQQGAGVCVGRPLAGIDVALFDFARARGEAVQQGAMGEVVVRGARVAASEARAVSDPTGSWIRTGDIGWIDKQGRLWLMGRISRTAHTRFGPVQDLVAESLAEAHPRVRRTALVAVGQPGGQEAVLVIEPSDPAVLKDDAVKAPLELEIRRLLEQHASTQGIRRVLFRKALPVDARSGAQANAREMATWIARDHS